MCGIIGYSGIGFALPKIVQGLSALEYRGYDSAGVAFFDSGKIKTVKSKGKIEVLKTALRDLCGRNEIGCGIGHTRWATHGEPSVRNAHPHGTERVALVHNGIIENYAELKEFLLKQGYTFESETDTEAAAKLIDFFYVRENEPVVAIREAIKMFRGSYAVCVMFCDEENKIFGFRKDSPLLVAPSENGSFFASDVSAVLEYTKQFRRLEEDEIAILNNNDIVILNEKGQCVPQNFETAHWDAGEASKYGFPHFMLKEICEEPEVVSKTVGSLLENGVLKLDADWFKDAKRIHIVACGTAMHAGMMGKTVIEKTTGISVSVELASEFRYCNPILDRNDIVIVISQSGETADTLAALRLAKKREVRTVGIVNVRGSSVAREADYVFYTNAGPEIAVASTKAYTAQISALLLIAMGMGVAVGNITGNEAESLSQKLLEDVPCTIEKALLKKEQCRFVAEKYKQSRSIFFMGRGSDYALSLEAALKMKEISYIHCEGIAAGEMKHGTISLITDGVPVFAFVTDPKIAEKSFSNIKEVSARGARVVLFCPENMEIPDGIAEDVIRIPQIDGAFATLVAATLAQLVAYYVACGLGLDVDKPRNLAKSVTVE